MDGLQPLIPATSNTQSNRNGYTTKDRQLTFPNSYLHFYTFSHPFFPLFFYPVQIDLGLHVAVHVTSITFMYMHMLTHSIMSVLIAAELY